MFFKVNKKSQLNNKCSYPDKELAYLERQKCPIHQIYAPQMLVTGISR